MNRIIQLEKGSITTTHSSIAGTATSPYIRAKGNNAMLVKIEISGSGAWTVKLQGAMKVDGTYVDLYDNHGTLMSTGSITTSRMQLFVGIPEYVKVVATEDSGTASVTVKVQPITK